jgi:hypothetical protein
VLPDRWVRRERQVLSVCLVPLDPQAPSALRDRRVRRSHRVRQEYQGLKVQPVPTERTAPDRRFVVHRTQ